MPTFVILGLETGAHAIPPIHVAAMAYPAAIKQRCDRIRVEALASPRVAEFPLSTVARFLRETGTTLTPGAPVTPGLDWEYHRPMWAPGLLLSPAPPSGTLTGVSALGGDQ